MKNETLCSIRRSTNEKQTVLYTIFVLYSGVGVESPLGIKYTKNKKTKLTALKSRVCGNFGFNSVRETTALIEKLEELSPELVHLHNIHSHDCNFEMLLSYLKERQIKTIWTFH